MNQSKTPETDAISGSHGFDDVVSRDFARTLETQRDEARAERDVASVRSKILLRVRECNRAQDGWSDALKERDALRAELEKVKSERDKALSYEDQFAKEKAMLDWLEKKARWHDPENRMKVIFPVPTVTHTTLRSAITAAMKEETK